MRVLVDTSAWIDFLNGHPSEPAETLTLLIDKDSDFRHILESGLTPARALSPEW